ncbi:MAG TPA: TonB-dependent receptor [Chitinophagaceae bacterium]|nr:TonB-dependent receptor [Chitinophagaceae bacterium]
MFRTILLCSAFILFHFSTIFAQDVIFIENQTNKENTIIGARIKIKELDSGKIIQGVTNENASFELPTGINYPIEITIDGFLVEKRVLQVNEKPKKQLIIKVNENRNALNEVIVTGVGRPTALDEAVSLYSIIRAEEIEQKGAHNLQDILRNELGISIGQDAMIGGTIKMQGMSGDNVKILVDGMPVNGREGQNIDLSTLNLNNVDRIEIVQGPMSVMYGADAIGGVINLISKENEKEIAINANAHYESIGRYNGDISLSKQIGKHNFTLQGGRNFFEGWDPEDNTKRDPLWRPKEQYMGHFKYHIPFHNFAGISFTSDFMHDRVSIKGSDENYSYYNRMVRDEQYYSMRSMNRLKAYWQTGKSGYWETNNSYSLYSRERASYFTDLSTMEQKLSALEGDQSQSVFHDFTFRTTYNNSFGKFSYTFGYDINLEFSESEDKIQDGKKEISDYAALLIADYQITKVLKLQPGIRMALNTQYKVPILPSMSLLYKPNKHYQVRLSYGRGFRAPTLKEMYLDFKDSNHDIYGNNELLPEQGHHFQFSTGYTLYEKKSNYNNISFSAFYNNVKNQISLAQISGTVQPGTPDPYTYVNIGEFQNLNLQLASENSYEKVDIKIAASLNQNFKTISFDAFSYWEAIADVGYTWERFDTRFLLNYKYTGKSPLMLTDVTGNVTVDKNIKTLAYHNMDFSAQQKFWKNRIALILGVKNIFNNTIIKNTGVENSNVSNIPGHGGVNLSGLNVNTGRSFFVSLRWAW